MNPPEPQRAIIDWLKGDTVLDGMVPIATEARYTDGTTGRALILPQLILRVVSAPDTSSDLAEVVAITQADAYGSTKAEAGDIATRIAWNIINRKRFDSMYGRVRAGSQTGYQDLSDLEGEGRYRFTVEFTAHVMTPD